MIQFIHLFMSRRTYISVFSYYCWLLRNGSPNDHRKNRYHSGNPYWKLLPGFSNIGDVIEHLVLILERFQILFPFVLGLLKLFQSIIPTSHRSSHSILDGTVGTHSCCKNMSGYAFMGHPAARLETMTLVIHLYVLV